MDFKVNSIFFDFYDRNNYKKFVVLGVILLSIGFYCIFRKSVGINILSWGLALCFLYAGWLAFKEVNELNKYAQRSQVNLMRLRFLIFLVIALLLFIFPREVNMFISITTGLFLLFRELRTYLYSKKYASYNFTLWNIIKIILAILLIISPLFFTRFLVTILSFIAIVFGINFISIGIRLVNN